MSITAQPLRFSSLASTLTAQIEGGHLSEGDRLPSERQLAEQFSVSRQTVRRALAELAEAHLIVSRPGLGTYVATRPVGEAPHLLMSFTEMGSARGLRAGSVVMDKGLEQAGVEDAELLGIAPGAQIFRIERLRLFDDLPIGVDLSRIPLALAPGLPQLDFTRASLYAALAQAGHPPVRADYTVFASAADARHARALGVELGFPLLIAQTVAYDPDGTVVEKGLMSYRGDRYRLQTELTRQPHTR
jgi:DNA-binding GntR family transcriptional regulator